MDKIWGIHDNDVMQFPRNIPNQRGTEAQSLNCNVNWVTVLNRNSILEDGLKWKKRRGRQFGIKSLG